MKPLLRSTVAALGLAVIFLSEASVRTQFSYITTNGGSVVVNGLKTVNQFQDRYTTVSPIDPINSKRERAAS